VVKDIRYMYWVKKDLFGCFRIEEIRDKDNETGLKEGEVLEMSTTMLPLRDAHSFAYHPALFSTYLAFQL